MCYIYCILLKIIFDKQYYLCYNVEAAEFTEYGVNSKSVHLPYSEISVNI